MRMALRLAVIVGLSQAAAVAMDGPQQNVAAGKAQEAVAAAASPGGTPPGQGAKTQKKPGTRAKKRGQREAPPGDGEPRTIVVREGGAREPAAQIAPGLPPAEANRQRQNAERILGATTDELQALSGRQLTELQQETMGQIRNYMDGSRSALKDGDVRRASTLAEKAQMLADDLAKH